MSKPQSTKMISFKKGKMCHLGDREREREREEYNILDYYTLKLLCTECQTTRKIIETKKFRYMARNILTDLDHI